MPFDCSESKKDKIHKLSIARKEAKESRFWLRTIKEADLLKSPELDALLVECLELIKILSRMINNLSISDDQAKARIQNLSFEVWSLKFDNRPGR